MIRLNYIYTFEWLGQSVINAESLPICIETHLIHIPQLGEYDFFKNPFNLEVQPVHFFFTFQIIISFCDNNFKTTYVFEIYSNVLIIDT